MGNPAVSVIIPLYNAEQYIGECLVSLLAQTFQDFEIIVVDDCSTDNSPAVVESYASKFGGRMTLAYMEENHGNAGLPRNKGLSLARGEYIQLLDNDDVLTKTALEELYTLAEDYDADVVYCEKYYMSEGRGDDFVKNVHPADSRIQKPPFVDAPTFETDDLSERVQEILHGRFWVTPWSKFVRRDLITRNEIFFPHCMISEDDVWTYGLVCHAKKFLRVPNMTYIRRMRESSVVGTQRTPQQTLNFWLNPVLFGLKSLDDILSRKKFFQENPQQRYAVLERFANGKFSLAMRAVEKFSSTEICDMIKAEYGARFGEYSVLIPLLCTLLGQDRKKLRANTNKLKQLDTLKKSEAAGKKRIAELETAATEFDALKKSAVADKKRIAELERELKMLKSYMNVLRGD